MKIEFKSDGTIPIFVDGCVTGLYLKAQNDKLLLCAVDSYFEEEIVVKDVARMPHAALLTTIQLYLRLNGWK